jgi:LysR family nitrogen assimilation transcriptional regulator
VARLSLWLRDTEQVAEELRAESGKVQGQVRLGIIPSAAHPLMTRLFQQLQTEHPGIHLHIVEAQGAQLDAMLDAGAVDLAILFRFHRPSGRDERLLSVAHTYLLSAPGDALTREPTLDFARLAGLRLVLPARPSHWRNALDETARSLGFRLQPVLEADSLTVQKEVVAHTRGVYSVLGPYSFAAELRAGRLSATKLVKPNLERHVTLALPKQGKTSPACRIVEQTIIEAISAAGQDLDHVALK